MANGTLLGTVAMALALLTRVRLPAVVGAGEIVAVRVPEAPAVKFSGLGVNCVGVGRIFVP